MRNQKLSNTCASSRRERIRRLPAVVVSPEEGLRHRGNELCVQGRLLGGKGEKGLEHVSSHLLTRDHTSPHRTGNRSASGPSAPCVRMCSVHTLWDYSEMYALTLCARWGKRRLWHDTETAVRWCESVLCCGSAQQKASAHSWDQAIRKSYSHRTFLYSPDLRVFTDWTETYQSVWIIDGQLTGTASQQAHRSRILCVHGVSGVTLKSVLILCIIQHNWDYARLPSWILHSFPCFLKGMISSAHYFPLQKEAKK